jgi:RNA polymerase sigma-70 factor (ECF subfamily)
MMRPSPNDSRFASLMRAAQGGDSEAYAQLLHELTPRLRLIVRRHCQFPGIEDVEDVVQDVLLSLHAVRATYDPARPFMPWLLAITRNRLVDSARRHARRRDHEVTVDDLAVTFSEPGTNTYAAGEVDSDQLKQAILELPAGQRQAIEALKLRELSLKEAAVETGSSVGALKVATHRAMLALRRRLKKE